MLCVAGFDDSGTPELTWTRAQERSKPAPDPLATPYPPSPAISLLGHSRQVRSHNQGMCVHRHRRPQLRHYDPVRQLLRTMSFPA
ncbi:hypothetical protein FS749_011630, partial [Ceratobasidium sp. UAMH 11750]